MEFARLLLEKQKYIATIKPLYCNLSLFAEAGDYCLKTYDWPAGDDAGVSVILGDCLR